MFLQPGMALKRQARPSRPSGGRHSEELSSVQMKRIVVEFEDGAK